MPQSLGTSPNSWVTIYRQEEWQAAEFYGPDRRHLENWRIDQEAMSPYWPGGGRFLGEGQAMIVAPPDYTPRPVQQAGNSQLGFSGVARGLDNSPVAGVTVRLFRSSNSQLVATAVSRADGSYNISTPYAGENHFIVCHKSGSPEIAGASIATLVPR